MPRRAIALTSSIDLLDIGHTFNGVTHLFEHLTDSFTNGDLVAITGPSGSGKSTLLAMCAGWVVPTAGEIVTTGIEAISYVPQNPQGVAERTALDHVALPYLAQGYTRDEAEERSVEMLERFHLETVAGQEFRTLSGGQAQRLMLAGAAARQASLILIAHRKLCRLPARYGDEDASRQRPFPSGSSAR